MPRPFCCIWDAPEPKLGDATEKARHRPFSGFSCPKCSLSCPTFTSTLFCLFFCLLLWPIPPSRALAQSGESPFLEFLLPETPPSVPLLHCQDPPARALQQTAGFWAWIPTNPASWSPIPPLQDFMPEAITIPSSIKASTDARRNHWEQPAEGENREGPMSKSPLHPAFPFLGVFSSLPSTFPTSSCSLSLHTVLFPSSEPGPVYLYTLLSLHSVIPSSPCPT